MENKNPMEIRKNLESRLIEKAWKDEEFKNELIKNTREVTEKELGIKIPGNIKVTVLEETADEVYLVLPQDPAKTGEMLTDAELDSVSGGGSGDVVCDMLEIWGI